MRTFCWWMCARLEQPVGSAVCEEHLAEEADEFLESLLNTFCASAEHLICLISPPPAIASQCFSPGLCSQSMYIRATVPECIICYT